MENYLDKTKFVSSIEKIEYYKGTEQKNFSEIFNKLIALSELYSSSRSADLEKKAYELKKYNQNLLNNQECVKKYMLDLVEKYEKAARYTEKMFKNIK